MFTKEYKELDPVKGVEYCGDVEDYIFAIETYSMSIDAKAEQIEDNLRDEDLEALALNVHSLKSTSAAIGACKLSDKAKEIELGAKAGDVALVEKNIPELLRDYRALKDILGKVLKDYEVKDESSRVSLKVVEEERNMFLTRALKEAEKANLAQTVFLSNVSHEIRTPLNDIVGLYNIALQKPDLDDDTRDIISQIGTCVRHTISLINDILEMSLIESGNMKLKSEEFSFGDMLEQINTITESKCDDKDIAFDCSIIGHIDERYIGDDLKLKQILFNIIENAINFTPAKGRVSLSVKEVTRNDKNAVISMEVSDTGSGIDEEFIPHIYEPFAVGGEDGGQIGRTGLGLAITRNIVEMMGGSIDVVSKKGKGSTFTVQVTMGICQDHEGDKYSFDPRRISALIVDDDVTACEHAKMILHKIGIESEYALSGEEALPMLKNLTGHKPAFNLILVDWKMPKMDGIELTRRIRQIWNKDDVTVILTTYNWYEVMEDAFAAGVNGFLAKPIFAGNIREELSKILAGRKKEIKKSGKASGLSGKRLILAEDHELNGRIMEQLLKLNDIEVDVVNNGEDAVGLFEKSSPGTYDAILMDIKMPKMNGLDATKAIRKLDREDAGSIPIVALTANALSEDIQLSFESGMNAHLSKPIEPDELFSVLRSLL